VHVLAVTRLSRAAVPAMLARGSGAIINIASLLAYSGPIPPQPLPYRATYAVSSARAASRSREARSLPAVVDRARERRFLSVSWVQS
jgi:uncharacterized protein